MWTLLVFTIISNPTYDYTIVTEVNNIKSRQECNVQKFHYERKSPFNLGYCEKQAGNEKIKPKYSSTEYRKLR